MLVITVVFVLDEGAGRQMVFLPRLMTTTSAASAAEEITANAGPTMPILKFFHRAPFHDESFAKLPPVSASSRAVTNPHFLL